MLPSKYDTRAGEGGGPGQGDRRGAIRRQICLCMHIHQHVAHKIYFHAKVRAQLTECPDAIIPFQQTQQPRSRYHYPS